MSRLSSGLSGASEGVPERFVPEEMHGQLVEAEHIARYWWATRFADGRRVLDAGCGTGYGAEMLRRAGAAEVVGVDIAEPVLAFARRETDGVEFEVADLRSLPFGDGRFDLVACFEALEHVDDPDAVLDELARVLAPGGLLVISSPNRDRYVPGNPHHRHEYVPRELHAALASRFKSVELLRQHVMVASVLSGAADEPSLPSAAVRRFIEPGTEDQIYTIAMAGDHVADPGHAVVTLTQFV